MADVVLITGAGRGIGREIAVRLGAAGYRLGLTARTGAELSVTERLVTEAGGRAVAVPADVTRPDGAERICTAVEEAFGPVHALVNCAGFYGQYERFVDCDPEVWWRVLETNLHGPALLLHRLLPTMIKAGRGRVVNLGTRMAFDADPGMPFSAYGVSKAALLRLSGILAGELAGTGVSVFDLSPGMVRTAMSAQIPGVEELPDEIWSLPSAAAEKVEALLSGCYDELHGHFVHVMDDLDDLCTRLRDRPGSRRLTLNPTGPDDPLSA
ncbi:SDR family oxidoreductase [Streptomyces sp. LHD-70]|uniref:SDR family NAD(P)-dependent oxidoreductase n=1 Tax=Streptomyces sp. LHD-70 TaxID=3072140 RepID=UPI00280D3B2F|nr:SDR family oxidoreductase [Streptomyces sp. LHD-70]MDQ8706034.1 SDR family oxidoreductase [Streptomyces sp. LHD-70]